MAKLPNASGITFYDGKAKLADGTAIKMPRQNLVPGLPVIKADGTNLPNGTYPDPQRPGTFFTVKEGKVGQLNAPKPVIEEVKPEEIAKEPEKLPVVADLAKPEEKKPDSEIIPDKKPDEVVITPEVVV